MLYVIEQVLDPATRQQIIHVLQTDATYWKDGKLTAGGTAQSKKNNAQLSSQHPDYPVLAQMCMKALHSHPVFMSAALPKTILPPLFSHYSQGHQYGKHVDSALQTHPETNQLIRTDLSLTLFLSDPDTYEGGELIIEDAYGEHAIKLSAGDAILYPSTSIHRVNAVTSGQRLAMVTWIQSLVKSNEQRQILHDLDISHILLRQKVQNLNATFNASVDSTVDSKPDSEPDSKTELKPELKLSPKPVIDADEELDKLSQSYHNLLRLWVEC